jgi:hypothetical protein
MAQEWHMPNKSEVKIIASDAKCEMGKCELNETSQALSNLALLSFLIGSGGRI